MLASQSSAKQGALGARRGFRIDLANLIEERRKGKEQEAEKEDKEGIQSYTW